MKKEKRISPVKVKQEASMEVFNAWNDFMETYHKDPKGRYQSYDHCRKVFLKYYKAGQPLSEDQYREVALNLYTFLASWGMLRKGFLLHRDYTCLIDVVKELYKPDWKSLFIEGTEVPSHDEYVEKVYDLGTNIRTILEKDKFYYDLKERKEIHAYSITLLTKIMMSTLGCTPAIDRFDKTTLLKEFDNSDKNTYSFSQKTLSFVWGIVNVYKDKLIEATEKVNAQLPNGVEPYTIFKVFDMCIWQYGSQFSTKKEDEE